MHLKLRSLDDALHWELKRWALELSLGSERVSLEHLCEGLLQEAVNRKLAIEADKGD